MQEVQKHVTLDKTANPSVVHGLQSLLGVLRVVLNHDQQKLSTLLRVSWEEKHKSARPFFALDRVPAGSCESLCRRPRV